MIKQPEYTASLVEERGELTAVFTMPVNPRYLGTVNGETPEQMGIVGADRPEEFDAGGVAINRLYKRVGSAVRSVGIKGEPVDEIGAMYLRVW